MFGTCLSARIFPVSVCSQEQQEKQNCVEFFLVPDWKKNTVLHEWRSYCSHEVDVEDTTAVTVVYTVL